MSELNAYGQNLPEGMIEMPRRIKRINSHVGLSRFLMTLTDTENVIPRVSAIPSPYAYSPEHIVYRNTEGLLVFVVETAHKTYDVFRVPATSKLSPAEVL